MGRQKTTYARLSEHLDWLKGIEPRDQSIIEAIQDTFEKLVRVEEHYVLTDEGKRAISDLTAEVEALRAALDRETQAIWARLNANAQPATMVPKRGHR